MIKGVNNDVRSKKITETELNKEFSLLNETADFYISLSNRKLAEINFLAAKLETEYSDEYQARFNQLNLELRNLQLKMNWEQKLCEKFDEKIRLFNIQKEQSFMKNLSKKITSSNSKKNSGEIDCD